MRLLTRIFLTIAVTLITGACADEPRPDLSSDLPVVVEGWIDEGEHPIVMITRAIDLTKPMDSLENYVEKWWRVSIDDGSKRYYLTARLNRDYIPSFVYTTPRLRGKAGGEYRLIIETGDTVITASTRILPHVAIDSLKVSTTANCDTLRQINAFIGKDPDGISPRFKFFSRVINRERRFYSSFLGTFERSAYNPLTGFSVSKGIHNTFEGDQHFSPPLSGRGHRGC